jgi:3-methyladenine DNA glycosylase/8-oxoguanine DNA glycosylase
MVQRNLELEKIALQDFVKKMGRLPQTSADWAEIHRTVYGYNLPEELKRVSEEAQRASGLTPSRDKMIESFSASSLLGEQQKRLAEARTEVEKARKAYEALLVDLFHI